MSEEIDKAREHRIETEIIVDAYNKDERAMGWYYYLEGAIKFPFIARCTIRRAISPVEVGTEIEVLGMAPEEECQHEMFVTIPWEPWGKDGLAVPLSQLEVIHGDDETKVAVEDWHYWVKSGYEF